MNTDKHRWLILSCLICVHLCSSVACPVFAEPPEPKFEAKTIDDAITIGYGLATGDADGDGKLDILLADAKQIVWYRNPDWRKFVIAENLTERDNVCLAARDINGDGKVELAVGAQWNPGETTDPRKSGAVFYLIRPDDPTQKWEPIRIEPHEPTVHRMRWVNAGNSGVWLLVAPLHGRGNKNGQGDPVKVVAYRFPADPHKPWEQTVIDRDLHMTHNIDINESADVNEPWPMVIIAGREGFNFKIPDEFIRGVNPPIPIEFSMQGETMPGAGEVRFCDYGDWMFAAIEPMHGNVVSLYGVDAKDGECVSRRLVLDETLSQGHALAAADVLKIGHDQIIAGWRGKNADGKVGIRIYVPTDEQGKLWKTCTIDDNTMACEDLKVADFDGDGRLDIVAAGRATKNVMIYWNRTPMAK